MLKQFFLQNGLCVHKPRRQKFGEFPTQPTTNFAKK